MISNPRLTSAGFTLTELVVVIIVATVLSAYAISRINTVEFDNEGYANRAAAMMRFAQKLAISQRRNVQVTISGNTLSLCYGTTTCSGGSVREPPGANAFSYAAPSGVTLSGSTFWFDALGKPSAGGTVTVSDGTTPRNITVEAETGYVH
jgi:MSHA pilin protein MshC